MPLPKYLYHATAIEIAKEIAKTGLEARSGGESSKYLCMSGVESGAITLKNKASDIIFRVATSKLNENEWTKDGAGKEEYRSLNGIEASKLEYRRNLGSDDQITWRSITNLLKS